MPQAIRIAQVEGGTGPLPTTRFEVALVPPSDPPLWYEVPMEVDTPVLAATIAEAIHSTVTDAPIYRGSLPQSWHEALAQYPRAPRYGKQ
jgi:hypothetical protein